MAQFATHDDFAARLGLTLSQAEKDRADALLTLASGLIQQKTKQKIERVTDDLLSVRSVYGERFRLPERPVVSVQSVTLTPQSGSPTVLDANTYYLESDELVRASFPVRYQQFFANWTRGWLGPLYKLDIVYTHGFADDEIPELVKAICMEIVVRVWVNPGSVAREIVGNVSTVYDNNRFSPVGLAITDAEKSDLTDLLRRHSSSIQLR